MLAVPAAFCFSLLEGVIDRDWEARVGLRSDAGHRLGHPLEEKVFCSLTSPMAMRSGDKLIGFRNCQRGKQRREYPFERSTQPDVEKVRQVRVADVVVVRRISRNDLAN